MVSKYTALAASYCLVRYVENAMGITFADARCVGCVTTYHDGKSTPVVFADIGKSGAMATEVPPLDLQENKTPVFVRQGVTFTQSRLSVRVTKPSENALR